MAKNNQERAYTREEAYWAGRHKKRLPISSKRWMDDGAREAYKIGQDGRKDPLNALLPKADIPWKRADYERNDQPMWNISERPFSPSFARWAGRNGKELRQTHRIDAVAAKAWGEGWDELNNELEQGEN